MKPTNSHKVKIESLRQDIEQGLAQARTTVNARDQREQALDKKQERGKAHEETRKMIDERIDTHRSTLEKLALR